MSPASMNFTVPSTDAAFEDLLLKEDPPYVFSYEKSYDKMLIREIFNGVCHTSFYVCALYLALVFALQQHMKSRPPLKLGRLLATWNLCLAVFSAITAWRSFSVMVNRIRIHEFKHTFCFREIGQVYAFWGFLFVLSKAIELGDTVFVVLRKQKLVFLHWYHHVTVLLFCWYSHKYTYPPSIYLIFMNSSVHAFMYAYYFVRSLGFKVPRWIMMFITSLQTFQMMSGLLMCLYTHSFADCSFRYKTISAAGVVMFLTYFILFLRFFYRSYVVSDRPAKRKSN